MTLVCNNYDYDYGYVYGCRVTQVRHYHHLVICIETPFMVYIMQVIFTQCIIYLSKVG